MASSTLRNSKNCDRNFAVVGNRSIAAKERKVAITLRRDEHLSIDIHLPKQCSTIIASAWG